MANYFKKKNKWQIIRIWAIFIMFVAVIATISSFSSAWFMDESSTSNDDTNVTYIGDLELDVTTNFKFKNLALAPDTIYTLDQSNEDIATYVRTSDTHDIDGAYVRIKYETTRKNVGSTTTVDNLDLLKLYFNGNLTTSTDYSDENTHNKWFYNESDDYYYYLGGVYSDYIQFNAGYQTTNRMINDYANADVTIYFTVDTIQRQYGAHLELWDTSPQVFKDMVAVESNITHVIYSTPIIVDGVSTNFTVTYGKTVSEVLAESGMNNTINNSNSCGWYADPECTIPLDQNATVTSSTKFYTKMATTDKLNITTSSSGEKTVTAVSSSITGEVVIPNDVEVIGYSAFQRAKITSLVIPESVKTIEYLSLYDSSIKSLYIPKSVTSINIYVGSPGTLESITVDPENPKYTDGGSDCIIDKTSKTLIFGCKNTVIPTDSSIVTTIGKYSFNGNSAITSMHIPANITEVINDGHTFRNSSNIAFTVDSGNTVFEVIDSCLVNVQTKTLYYMPNGANIPNTNKVEKIGTNALHCDSQFHVTKHIKEFSSYQSGVKSCTKITCSSENDYYYAKNNCLIEKSTNKLIRTAGKGKIIIPDEVEIIETECFVDNLYLSSIIISSGVTTLEEKAFAWTGTASNRIKVYLPSTCTNISANAFGSTCYLEIYTDVSSASSKPSGWNANMVNGTDSSITWHYGTTLEQFKTIAGYTD